MEITAQKVLLVDDNPGIREVAQRILQRPNRAFFHASDGAEALDIAFAEKPDIVLLDYMMPEKNGIEVIRDLRGNPFTSHVPIIMVTATAHLDDRVAMMRAGADDCIGKPFEPRDLAARVEMVLARTERHLATDSLTRLPGNVPTRNAIRARLAADTPFCLCYLDIDSFKSFVDHYGYERASAVIASVARVIEQGTREQGGPEHFVGHIGGDDFVILTATDRARPVCHRCLELFDELVPGFYDADDAERGFIMGHRRDGAPAQFPLITISAVIVPNGAPEIQSPHALADLVVQLKARAKQTPGSTVIEHGNS
ncbi:MAG: response regulator [Armatimonadota bacterium]|jgi:PleD family two-component response regulator